MTDEGQYGAKVSWKPVKPPDRVVLSGRYLRVEPLRVATHGSDLFRAAHGPGADPELWSYMPNGPYGAERAFLDDLTEREASLDPLFFAIVDPGTSEARGVASLMRIDATNGVGEIGHIWFGPQLQRTRAATESIYLLANYLLTTLGYRRFEWKCNALNARSRRAAVRYGFTYEGIFRQHMVVKGRNRDTAWYAIVDADWPAIRAGFEAWLAPENFDGDGMQVRTLAECRS